MMCVAAVVVLSLAFSLKKPPALQHRPSEAAHAVVQWVTPPVWLVRASHHKPIMGHATSSSQRPDEAHIEFQHKLDEKTVAHNRTQNFRETKHFKTFNNFCCLQQFV
eukprot:1348153-Amphidinium_carterae.1